MSINENQQPGHDDREPIKDPVFEAAPEPKVPTVQTSLFKPESADAQAANGSGDDLISDSKALADAQTADGQTRQYERAAAALNYHPGQFPGRVKPVADSAEGESDPTSRSEAGGTGDSNRADVRIIPDRSVPIARIILRPPGASGIYNVCTAATT